MAEPHIFDRRPAVIELEPGTYHWCACGLSNKQPFCDGSHAGGAFRSVKFEITEKKRVALCNCKKSGTSPFCDGQHSKLD